MKFTKPVLFAFVLLWSYASVLTAQQFKRFDINKTIKNSRLTNLVSINDRLYFAITDYDNSYQTTLMYYDGINQPVVAADFGNVYITQIRSFKNRLYLTIVRGLTYELWEYDEMNGARLLEDFTCSKCTGHLDPFHLIEFHDKLYFTDADLDESSYYQCKYQKNFWEYDGISSPRKVNYFDSVNFDVPGKMVLFNDKIYFNCRSEGYERLASWDGYNPIEVEPFEFKDINGFIVFKNSIYFSGKDSSSDQDEGIWSFNGADELIKIKDINTLKYSYLQDFRIINDRMFFEANYELWVYDGQSDPHVIVELNPDKLTFYNDKYYFFALDSLNWHLWSFNDIKGFPVSKVDIPGDKTLEYDELAVFKDRLYLSFNDKLLGPQLWSYDSLNSLSLVHQFIPGTLGSIPSKLSVGNNKLYFTTDIYTPAQLWEHDGNNELNKIYQSPNLESISILSCFNNRVLFRATDEIHGSELWIYNENNIPVMIKDINPGKNGSYPRYGCQFKNRFYFDAEDGKFGRELWGYENDAAIVMDIFPGVYGSNPGNFLLFADKLLFSANDGIHGKELWTCDGNSDPVMVKDINPGSFDSFKSILGILNEKLYFIAHVSKKGMKLMEYDGNTEPVIKENITIDSLLNISKTVLLNNKLYFSLGNSLKSEIWEFDGFNNPELIFYGEKSGDLFNYQDKLFFFASDSLHGMEPWMYDGLHKPEMLIDINHGIANSSLNSVFEVVNNILYFNATDDQNGNCIWSYDGSNEPSIVNGYLNLDLEWASNLKSFRNKLYFTATDIQYGNELWSYCPCPPTTGTMNLRSCEKIVSPSGKYTWTESGIYCDTIPNAFGCDSIITISLTIPEVDSSLTQNGNTLISNASGATYQWIKCNPSPANIEGATDSLYSATENGYYAVIISKGECVDTSVCCLVSIVDMQDRFGQSLRVYPNPANDMVRIELGEEYEGLSVKIRNSTGELIKTREYGTANVLDIELGNVSGLYLIEIRTKDNNIATVRVIKE